MSVVRISIGLESSVTDIGEEASPLPPKVIGDEEGGITAFGVRIAAARTPSRSGVFIGSVVDPWVSSAPLAAGVVLS